MTIPQQPPVDPDAVAEVAPGQGPEPGSAYYGGSVDPPRRRGERAGRGGADLTTGAGTFQDLPVSPDEQVE